MKATINVVEINEEEIDFSKTQLVIDNDDIIVLVTGHFNNDIFNGVIISNGNNSFFKKGEYFNNFKKDKIKKLPSNQSITLQND